VLYLKHQPHVVADAPPPPLQLSGHTHRGQIFPFNFLVKLEHRHTSGMATINGGMVYVNRGTGCWGPPLRVWSPPEISLFILTPE